MSDIPKQELDELFREGAGMQTFDYNEAAWDKMETMLDNDDRNRKIGMWLLLLIGVALAVMAGFYYTSLDSISTKKETIYANQNFESQSSSTQNQIAQTEVQEINESIKTSENTEATQKVVASNAVNNDNKNRIVTKNVNPVAEQKVVNYSTATENFVSLKEKASTIENVILSNDFENKDVVSIAKVFDEESVEQLSQKEFVAVEYLQNRNSNLLSFNDSYIENYHPFVTVQNAIYEDEDKGASIFNRLSYSIFAAPEWSSVGVDGPKERGYKFGAKIGFQIANHWELSTGLSLSQKKFNGKGSQFTISEGWVDDIMPMTMAGKCNIFEIPLDVVYHFNGVGESGFFASAGLRAYMLHSEWYGFEYNTFHDNNPDLIREKVMDNQNKNWLGSVELSLGYNKKVSNNLSVQIAPYLQIPATGFGDGKVNLYSGGVQFAARFDSK